MFFNKYYPPNKSSIFLFLFSFIYTFSFGQKNKVISDSLTNDKDLDSISVHSRYYRNYNISNLSNSLKLQHPIQTFSQNIQEVDKSVLEDQIATNINESVTRNVSGAMRNNTADFYSPYIYMRGAQINTLRNGMDLSMIYYGPMPEDAALIDRIEFIKGPAGFMNAIGDPAGSFNVVTRQPLNKNINRLNITTGSYDLYRVTGDFNNRLDKNGKWLLRVNLAGQKSNSFQRFTFNNKFIIDPVLRYNINSHSSITAEYIYQYQKFNQYLTTIFSPLGFASLPRDFSISDSNKKPVRATENNAFITYNNHFSNNWNLTTKITSAQDYMDGNYFFIGKYDPSQPDTIWRRVTYERFKTQVYALQTYISGNIPTGTINNNLLIGLDGNYKKLLGYSGYNDPNADQTLYPLNVLDPQYGINFDPNVKSGNLKDIATNQQYIKYVAFYGQDEINFFQDHAKLTIGARYTISKTKIEKPSTSQVSNDKVTPRVGLSYSLNSSLSFYALHDQTFTPQTGISADGGTFKPLTGNNLEFGIKKEWANRKWNSTFSSYLINRKNVIVTDPNTNLQSQIGATRTKGIELDVKGEIFKGLDMILNYAYTDSYVTEDANQSYIGNPTPYRVKNIQNTWLHYRLPLKTHTNWSVFGGYQFQGGRASRYPQDGNLHLSNIFRVDGGLGYSKGHLSINGLINNIFNRFNYGSAWARPTGIYAYVPLTPREYRLSISYQL